MNFSLHYSTCFKNNTCSRLFLSLISLFFFFFFFSVNDPFLCPDNHNISLNMLELISKSLFDSKMLLSSAEEDSEQKNSTNSNPGTPLGIDSMTLRVQG